MFRRRKKLQFINLFLFIIFLYISRLLFLFSFSFAIVSPTWWELCSSWKIKSPPRKNSMTKKNRDDVWKQECRPTKNGWFEAVSNTCFLSLHPVDILQNIWTRSVKSQLKIELEVVNEFSMKPDEESLLVYNNIKINFHKSSRIFLIPSEVTGLNKSFTNFFSITCKS